MEHLFNSLKTNAGHPLSLLLFQVCLVMLVARFFGWICRKTNQPAVIGEIIAGIILGPSLFGWCFPEISKVIFPATSFGNLKLFSQIGLLLFMFVVGMELDLSVLKNKAKSAVVISYTSILFPFVLGLIFAYFIYERMAPAGVPFSSFGMFMGIAMSITAFPVLVRIVQEKGLKNTSVGIVAIACAAADDVTAWCILAVIIAFVKAGTFGDSLLLISLIGVYVAAMLFIVKPLLKNYAEKQNGKLTRSAISLYLMVLLISGFVAELIEIHALFGAFLAGIVMPSDLNFRKAFSNKIEDLTTVMFLPLFFVLTGLRTEISLLNNIFLWQICGIVVFLAVLGKFAGSAFAAKLVGQSWKDSLIIGALMNTRGLMELIVLNIGYDLGIISKEMFSIMVFMALITTVMTGPVLDFINKKFKTVGEPLITHHS